MIDPYAVLGVSRSVTDDELTGAYRKLAKRFHPDMNSGSKAAEKKMQEINAAYDQIKNERSGGGSGAGASQSGGSRGPYRYGGAYGSPFGGWGAYGGANRGGSGSGSGSGGSGSGGGGYRGPFGPFGGFGWYDENDDSYGTAGDASGARDPSYSQVHQFIQSGYYQQALQLLFAFDAGSRGAEWFYYSALGNLGIGNRVTALRHAQEAVRLEPNVAAYRSLLYQLEQGAYVYRQAGASQGFDMRNIGRALLQCLFSQLLCYCFCCRPC